MPDTSYITVPSLHKWQHYKDRCPPWIKLHRDVLNDYEFSCLQDASKAHLLGIWLLASQLENKVPNDSKWIARRINATDKIDLKSLVASGFIEVVHVDSDMLAPCKQNALVETETETETETTLMPESNSDENSLSDNHDLPAIKTEGFKIASLMADTILQRDPGYRFLVAGEREKTLANWSDDIEKIHRLDDRPWEQIRSVVEWCMDDDFWSRNILSGSKLRKQFDQLVLKMPAANNGSGIAGDNDYPDFMQGVQ
ncbi:hypothetical protein [Desulfopila sp. IMCC35008]|uniref:hypothetical protein n=1 Tax=Desulfopila sp. IMCC35008 TaxID=2653858 RepID=UPI0013D39AC6|nr:hypothetical protein [Desulfopila sp. IMCC35008]